MPKKIPESDYEQILNIVACHQEGISKSGIYKVLKGSISKRTLHRRLAELAVAGKLAPTGKARALRYKLAVRASAQTADMPDVVGAKVESYVPMSDEGKEIRNYVRQEIQQRKPVGYNREFLESYTPNQTFYLSDSIRKHLNTIGQTPVSDHPAGTYARDILNRLLIDLSWASSRLEGNTYTRLDTQNLIEFGRVASGKEHVEATMILNHKAAIEFLIEDAEEIGFNTYTIRNLHALLSDNLLADPAGSGRTRNRIVEISGTVYRPLSIPQQLEEFFQLILGKADQIKDPFEQAFFIMVHIPYLQPFVDVNKRASRLGANIPLIKNNLCPLSFVDVPDKAYVEGTLGVYELCKVELLRDVFVWAYERSCQQYIAIKETVAEPDPFRFKYRQSLMSVVGEIVKGKHRPSETLVKTMSMRLVPKEDIRQFVELVLNELYNLHEGNLSRYRIRLSEFRAWQPLQKTN